MAACAATDNFVVLLTLRALTGVAGAFTFIVGAGLVAQVSAGSGRSRTALLLGIYVTGGGAGIVISGLTITPLLASAASGVGWRTGWLLLGAMSAVALAGTIPAVRAAPEPPPVRSASDRWPARGLAVLMVAYGFFGVGYIAYMTFIVAFLVGEGATAATVTLFWVVLGLSSVPAAFGWGPLLGRLRGGHGPALVLGVLALGALLPLLGNSAWLVFASAVLFGASFLTVVTAMTVVAQHSLDPRHWTPAIAALTSAFAVGQCAGPVLAGLLSDSAAGVRAGLILSVVALAAGVLLSLAQRERRPHRDGSPDGTVRQSTRGAR
jgi:predicted MFS family arabinose efflux permease